MEQRKGHGRDGVKAEGGESAVPAHGMLAGEGHHQGRQRGPDHGVRKAVPEGLVLIEIGDGAESKHIDGAPEHQAMAMPATSSRRFGGCEAGWKVMDRSLAALV